MAGGLISSNLWMNFACFVLSTYLMVELNNTNSLIRTYSRSVSCAFLILSSAACFLFTSMQGSILQLCFIAFYTLWFRCYQDKHAVAWVFYAFFCLGLGSLVFIQILYYVPAIWILMIVNLRGMGGRSFVASLIGLAAPYWFCIGYYAFQGDINPLISHICDIAAFQPISSIYEKAGFHQILTLFFIIALAVIGIVHYLRTSFNDKIRVRMLFEILITMDVLTMVFLGLQPQHYDILIRLLIINTAPLIAHYVTLTHTWLTNISFIIMIIAALLLTAYNLWTPLSIFL